MSNLLLQAKDVEGFVDNFGLTNLFRLSFLGITTNVLRYQFRTMYYIENKLIHSAPPLFKQPLHYQQYLLLY
jgi:hypothetical protein